MNEPNGRMPRKVPGAKVMERGEKCHPNGGGVKPMDRPAGSMPGKSGGKPIQGAPLNVGSGASGLGQMPRKSNAQRQRDPYRS